MNIYFGLNSSSKLEAAHLARLVAANMGKIATGMGSYFGKRLTANLSKVNTTLRSGVAALDDTIERGSNKDGKMFFLENDVEEEWKRIAFYVNMLEEKNNRPTYGLFAT